ncbi:testis-specific protein TEX28 [Thamnophis elegans]|uniref:testis-specific protein TEX28 n=1 Tax=Thamnophis elegans TaxID=35005 RepID=UPI00137749C1|nr:testis-specific protein TEX28 [Thamnophis elegans]
MVDYNLTKEERSQQSEASTSQAPNVKEKLTVLDESRAENMGVDTKYTGSSSRSRRSSDASGTSQSSYRSPKDALRHRILHLSELLRVEKANREENLSTYVELVSKADRDKAPSIRQAFERINQRSSANIAHLEQRLQDCLVQLKKLEQKNFPPADNSSSSPPQTLKVSVAHPGPYNILRFRPTEAPLIEEGSIASSAENEPITEAASKQHLEEDAKKKLHELKSQIMELKDYHKALDNQRNMLEEAWKVDKKQIMEVLQEEKLRHYNLEIQVNDVVQLNLNEITNLKHDLACTEEKMVYQSYERSRDVWEVLDSYQTRLVKLEQQQQAQQQEAMEVPQASMYKLYGQLMNLLLTIAAIILVFFSTISAFIVPLLHTPMRAMSTLLVIVLITLAWNHFSDITESDWKTWLSSS